MNTSYTDRLDERMWQIYGTEESDADISKEMIIGFLNDSSSFRTFGEGILYVISTKYPDRNINKDNVIPFLNECCEKSGVDISEIASPNTLKNWFVKGSRPKKGEASRRTMFALAFALSLTVADTQTLFHKVYLDRAFNFRDESEIIYYYCIRHEMTWADADRLIGYIDISEETRTDKTQYTALIRNEIDRRDSEGELLEFIKEHGHNFEKNSVKATEEFARLLSQAKATAYDEAERTEHKESYKGKWQIGESVSSNFLYELITGMSITDAKGTKTLFTNNVNLPTEIKNRFPEAATFSKKDLTSEARRKGIILLFSYDIWCKIQWRSEKYDLEDYTAQLDTLLYDCNYPSLYYGNPFDWLFLYCTITENPLDTFREIIYEVMDNE